MSKPQFFYINIAVLLVRANFYMRFEYLTIAISNLNFNFPPLVVHRWCAVVSRTVTFPDRRFLDKTFPGQTIPGQDVFRTDVSRTRRFPDRRFPDKTFPGQTIPGQTFPGQYVFEAPFYSRWRRARQPFDCQLQTQRKGKQEHNEWRIVKN